MNKTVLIIIGIFAALLTAAGIIHYTPINVARRQLHIKFPSVLFRVPTGAEESIRVVTSLLEDDDQYVRQWAAAVLGKLNSKESIPQIKELLKAQEYYVRDSAQEALKYLGVPEAEIEEAKEGK